MARRLLTVALVVAGLFTAGAVALWLSPYRVGVIHTGSMERKLPLGSAVIIKKGPVHIGQPVYYWANDEYVTHVLLSVDPQGRITTRGTNNPSNDPWHPPITEIVGGEVADIHYLGYVLWIFDLFCPFHVPYGEIDLVLIGMILWLVNGMLPRPPAEAQSDPNAALAVPRHRRPAWASHRRL